MKNERILAPSVFALIALLHVGLVSVLWRSALPVQGVVEHIEFIDLGDFGSGNGRPAGAPATVASPPPPPKPAAKPKVVEPPKSVVKPVVTRKEQADIRQQPEKPKSVEKPKLEPKPQPKAEQAKPKQESAQQAAKQVVSGSSDNLRAANESSGSSAAPGTGSSDGRGGGRGDGRSAAGSGSGTGSGTGAGSSPANAIKATGTIPRPPYPPLSHENSEEGTVTLKVMVAPGGKVSDVVVAKSSGYRRLDRAAQQAARNGRFQAAAWTEYTVPVTFKLQ